MLEPGEDEAFLVPEESGETASLYEHCCRALDRSLTQGVHGLPLMGTGDWNGGMNNVGAGGIGESVWLGWFLYSTLTSFAEICDMFHDKEQCESYRKQAEDLRTALESSAAL